ncbi:YbjC family protein [Enterobacteriaceae bacterium C34A]
MRSLGRLPKSVLILEMSGMALMLLAWLSLNHYVALPAWLASPTAGIIMIFAGILLMIPAAVALLRGVAQTIAPQLMQRDDKPTSPDQEKRNDADH